MTVQFDVSSVVRLAILECCSWQKNFKANEFCKYIKKTLLKYVYVVRVTCQSWAFHMEPPPWRCGPTRVMASSFLRFLDHTQRRVTVGRTPLDEWSARRRNLHMSTYNTHNRQSSMFPVGFEPTISAGERPQAYLLDRAATVAGW